MRNADLDAAGVFEAGWQREVDVSVSHSRVVIVHEEHKRLQLEPNMIYYIHRAREFNYLEQAARYMA